MGCIFAEIVLRLALFPGNSDIEQLGKIFNVLGTPKLDDWPGMNLLPNYIEFEPREPLDLSKVFSKPREGSSSANSSNVNGLPSDLDLILKMLALNPSKRISAAKVRAVSTLVPLPHLFLISLSGFEACLLPSGSSAMRSC